jgi:hypothetical protein
VEGGIFRNGIPKSGQGTPSQSEQTPVQSQVKFVISDLSEEAYRDENTGNLKGRAGTSSSPGSPGGTGASSDYFHS